LIGIGWGISEATLEKRYRSLGVKTVRQKNELHHTKTAGSHLCLFFNLNFHKSDDTCASDPRESALSCGQNKTPTAFAIGVSEFNLDDDLLSHGETPHYHRRCIVSLLSSGWDQVVPMLYGRQEIRVPNRGQLAPLQQNGYVIASVFCEYLELSVRFVFTHRNLASFEFTNCLGVIWSSLTGN
jgi:hypothetical protein